MAEIVGVDEDSSQLILQSFSGTTYQATDVVYAAVCDKVFLENEGHSWEITEIKPTYLMVQYLGIFKKINRENKESNVKESNPKDKVGRTKVPITTLSFPVLAEMGVAMQEGALKYGKHNYREIGVCASVYLDAIIIRHLGPWAEGQNIDPDSGLSHLTKAMSGLMVLRDAQMRGKMEDDRPKGTIGWLEYLNQKTADLQERYPTPKEPFLADGREPDNYIP